MKLLEFFKHEFIDQIGSRRSTEHVGWNLVVEGGDNARQGDIRGKPGCDRPFPMPHHRHHAGGIDSGARVATVNSSGASCTSPKVRDSVPVSHPPRSASAVSGGIMRDTLGTGLMSAFLRSPGRKPQDLGRIM